MYESLILGFAIDIRTYIFTACVQPMISSNRLYRKDENWIISTKIVTKWQTNFGTLDAQHCLYWFIMESLSLVLSFQVRTISKAITNCICTLFHIDLFVSQLVHCNNVWQFYCKTFVVFVLNNWRKNQQITK